jgi:nicotinamidase-related amidase
MSEQKIVIGKGEYQIELVPNPMWETVKWRDFVKMGKVALLVIDAENDCCMQGGALDKIGWHSWQFVQESGSVDNIANLIKACRRINAPVIWTRVFRKKDFADCRPGSWEHTYFTFQASMAPGLFEEGSWDVEVIDELLKLQEPRDLVVDKVTSISFINTGLDRYLRNWSIETVIVAGFYTSFCVEGTARAAFDLGYLPIVVGDACMDMGQDKADALKHHRASLQSLEAHIALAHVVSTEEIIKLLNELV